MVFRMNITYNEKANKTHRIFIGIEIKPFSFSYGLYEVRETNNTLNSILLELKKTDIKANDFERKLF